jgi:PAS domain-containing protein
LVNKVHGPFTEHDLKLLVSMAAFVAIAIENARLYVALRDHASLLEKEVANRTRELRAILNSVADGLVVTDADDKVVMANPAARRWLSFREDPSLQQEKASILWHAIQGLARVSDAKQTAELNIPLLPGNGRPACYNWFECTAGCPAHETSGENPFGANLRQRESSRRRSDGATRHHSLQRAGPPKIAVCFQRVA